MKEELHHDNSITVQITLEAANVLETLVPDMFGHERWRNLFLGEKFGMDADNQRFFVITAIEDANVAAVRQAPHATP